ncbi:hypothetical protein [Hymenobacter nivis]|uniref:hypothetical protein n=1 Tax=Hymenobacter nivis TaxID=1850093 RepID=UPI0013A5B448|nr:hypothetical protein [Hymenobacter nivis]
MLHAAGVGAGGLVDVAAVGRHRVVGRQLGQPGRCLGPLDNRPVATANSGRAQRCQRLH